MQDFKETTGKLFVLFGPSGSGKTTLKKQACAQFSAKDLQGITTVTTRSPRPGEVDGVDYFFLSPEEFEGLKKAGLFFEATNFLGNSYGVPLSEINFLNLGQNLIVAVELEGVKKFAAIKNAVLILVTAQAQELASRVVARHPDLDMLNAEQRLAEDTRQIHLALQDISFKYTIVNHELSMAVEELKGIIRQEIS